MHTVTPTSVTPESPGSDSIETLGLSGATLMQLWSIGVATISDLDSRDSANLKKRLGEALGKSTSVTSRIEKALVEIGEALKGREPLLKAKVIELKPALRKPDTRVEDALTEDERAYAAMPSSITDPIPLLTYHMRRHKLLGHAEQMELARRVRDENDQRARDLLVSHNLRLVRQVASRYKWSKLELADLIQEGVIGLMTAIEKFDHTKGFTFATYATWWIRQGISRAVQEQSDLIRIPVHLLETIGKMRRVMNSIATQEGRPPTLPEIATALKVSTVRVQYLLKVLGLSNIISIDAPPETGVVGGRFDEEKDWYDLLADESYVPADIILIAREELDQACERLNSLAGTLFEDETISVRNRDIFMEFYGLTGSFLMRTLEHVSDSYFVTRQRVQQVIATCWEKVQLKGIDMDHESVVEEYLRIRELEKLARVRVSVG